MSLTNYLVPVYKIEVYHGANLIHTITKNAQSIYTKEILTDGVGHFKINLAQSTDQEDKYNDIVNFDKVNVYYGYEESGGVGATPDFVGKIYNMNRAKTSEGYLPTISGYSQGEILQRRLKNTKIWSDVHACDGDGTPVHDIADDLSIYHAGDIDTETNHVTIQVDSENYFDILRKVSDYWVSAGTQLKYDFLVNVDGHLHWKARPWRTVGVPTFTVDKNIISYSLIRNIDAVNNNITIYGEQGKVGVPGQNGRTEPSDGDLWTLDAAGNWTVDLGSIASDATAKVGANSLKASPPGAPPLDGKFRRNIVGTVTSYGVGAYQTLSFYHTTGGSGLAGDAKVRLYAPDSSNYYEANIGVPDPLPDWTFKRLQLGQNQEYDATTNPTGVWTKSGSPNWAALAWLTFYVQFADGLGLYYLDGLYFGHGRFRYSNSDATSISNYGQRDLVKIYDNLTSDAQCESRFNTLLYQLKDEPSQITITTPGSTNVLCGDRVSITLPLEDISAANYDITTVENTYMWRGEQTPLWDTKATMINTANIRTQVQSTPMDRLRILDRQLRELGRMDRSIW